LVTGAGEARARRSAALRRATGRLGPGPTAALVAAAVVVVARRRLARAQRRLAWVPAPLRGDVDRVRDHLVATELDTAASCLAARQGVANPLAPWVERLDIAAHGRVLVGVDRIDPAGAAVRFAAMTDLGGVPSEPPVAGDETATLLGSLERQRATLAWKCGGLDGAGLRATLGPSTITLGGLLKHLALVEDHTFAYRFRGEELGPPWDAVDWDADPDWEWRTAAEDTPEQLTALWQAAVARSRATVAGALAGGDLGQLGRSTTATGESPSLRRLVIDLVEEYARHVGHADLVRESVDGLVGEDPPR